MYCIIAPPGQIACLVAAQLFRHESRLYPMTELRPCTTNSQQRQISRIDRGGTASIADRVSTGIEMGPFCCLIDAAHGQIKILVRQANGVKI
ncbi:MAG: hypothetical protein WBX30_19300 [Stellaceae bacterium]